MAIMIEILQKLSLRSAIDFPGVGISIDYPSVTGVFKNGLWSAIGFGLSFFFTIMIMIWIGYSIYAAFKISHSGMEKDFETGITMIKNVWISISIGILFFVFLNVLGSFLGVGSIPQWYVNLAQCNGTAGGFYFKDMAMQSLAGIPEGKVYCCKVTAIAAAPVEYLQTDFKDNTWHFVIEGNSKTGFSECTEFLN
jgi:hypothetical protein